MLYTFYAAGFASLIIFFLTYYFLGLEALITNTMMLGMYAFIVPCIFFTFGAWVEQLIVEQQIGDLVDEFKTDTSNFGASLPSINIKVDKTNDEKVKDDNRVLIEYSFLFVISLLAFCFLVTYLLWRYIKNEISYSEIFYENLIILAFIIVVELFYFGFIVRNYKTVDSNTVISLILKNLGEKFDP